MTSTYTPDSIRTAMRELGYPSTDWTADDPDLAYLAAVGSSPDHEDLAKRVAVTKKYSGKTVRLGMSPSNMFRASFAKQQQWARDMGVPPHWLVDGSAYPPDEATDLRLDIPNFMKPYHELCEASNSIIHLFQCYGFHTGRNEEFRTARYGNDWSPDQWIEAILIILQKANTYIPTWKENQREEVEYRAGKRKYPPHLPRDPFYKFRPDGEMGQAYIEHLPNLAIMLPHLNAFSEAWMRRAFSVTATKAELNLLAGALGTAIDIATSRSVGYIDWKDKADKDPNIVEMLLELHGRLITAGNGQPAKKSHGARARPGAGRRQKERG